MECESCEGLDSHFVQYEKPKWEPLEEVLGDRLGRDRLDLAIKRALCPWWLLAGWEEADLKALQEAIRRTPPSHVWKP